MSSLTQEEFAEISRFEQEAPTKFPGLFFNDGTLQARANTQSIASYISGRNEQYSVASLSAAVVALQFTLLWAPGFAPVTPVALRGDTRTQRQRAHDGGIAPYEREGTHADTGESSWARDIREGREKHVADNKKRERDEQRYRETHQTVMTANGRISYAQSEAVNKAAALRHAQEDSLESGRPITVATGPRSIPSSETDPNYQAWLRTASADDIKIFLSRKGRSHLMR
jgi:hypothetical protein